MNSLLNKLQFKEHKISLILPSPEGTESIISEFIKSFKHDKSMAMSEKGGKRSD